MARPKKQPVEKVEEKEIEQPVEKVETNVSEKPEIKSLVFKKSGWCEKLGKSYFQGVYMPKSEEEYKALKEFAE